MFNHLRSVQFLGDGKRGWAVGESGTILATQNGGESWQSQTSGTSKDLWSVQFLGDGKRGWAVGESGTILTTQNGGESWQSQTSGTSNYLWSVQFLGDGKRGWAVGESGTILTTQNGGESWQSQTSGTSKGLWSVQFLGDGKRGWAVGESGTILRIDPPELRALNDAKDLMGVKAALSGLGVPDQSIGQSLDTMRVLGINRQNLMDQIERDKESACEIESRPAKSSLHQNRSHRNIHVHNTV